MSAAIGERQQFNTRAEIVVAAPELSSLLAEACEFLKRFIAFSSEAQGVAIALWIAHTWTIDAFDYTPYLHVLSPEKRCGKSRLLDCIGLLAAKPWRVVSPSEAVLFRKIEADSPTLLLDEVDTIFCGGKDDGKEPLRALLNAGFERRAKIPRCVRPNNELREFAVFGAKALAGIGKLPDTVSDRCIPIRLVRRAQNEAVERFRTREADAIASTTRDALARWSGSERTRVTLRDARPDIPDQLGDRQADICEPLFAIADLAGDGWPKLARAALVALCSSDSEEDESLGVKLLSGIQSIFEAKGSDRLATKDILEGLVSGLHHANADRVDEDVPWATWWERDLADKNTRGPAARLAKLLKPFGIHSRGIRLDDGTTPRGYLEDDFREAWKRYCPAKET